MKFYFVKLTHKTSNKHFFKFGITSKYDVLERFNAKYDTRYTDFNIKVIFSIFCTSIQAQKMETNLLSQYPKNFMLEPYLNIRPGTYDNLSGITECFIADDDTVQNITFLLYRIKEKILSKI